MRSNNVVGLALGNDHFFFNVGFEEFNETNVALVDLLNQELKERDEEPTELIISTIGENEVAIAIFPGTRSQFEKERGLFAMKYWAITTVENYMVRFVAYQNTDENEQLLPTLKKVLGSVRSRSMTENCS